MSTYDVIHTLGGISLLCGAVGVLLFIAQIAMARKLLFRVSLLRNELVNWTKSNRKMTNSDSLWKHDHLRQIRTRTVDVDVFAILVSCFVELPQITIIIVVTLSLSRWIHFAVPSLLLSVCSFTLKVQRMLVDASGCREGSSEGTLYGMEYEDSVQSLDIGSTSVSISVSSGRDGMRDGRDSGHNYRNIKFQPLNEEMSDQEVDEEMYIGNGHSILMETENENENRMRLMSDSDEEDSEMEEKDEAVIIKEPVKRGEKQMNRRSKRRKQRSLKISRRVRFRKHKLLAIEEENSRDDWSSCSPL